MCNQRLFGNQSKHYRETFVLEKDNDRWKEITAKMEKLNPEWFKGKRVLDIGSHDGAFDLVMAAKW